MSMITDNRTPLFTERVRVFACDFDAASKVAYAMSNILGSSYDDEIDAGRIAVLALCSRKMRQDGLSPDVIMATVAAALDCEEADTWARGNRRFPTAHAGIEFQRAKAVWRRNIENGIERRTRAEQNRDEDAEARAIYQASITHENVIAFTPRQSDEDESSDELDEGA
jgi:hypothetical protein